MRKIGYSYLINEFELSVPPLTMHLYQGDNTVDEVRTNGQYKAKILSKRKTIGNSTYDHIEVAINYEGIRLAYLHPLFQVLDETELAAYIKSKPHSTIRRAIWYLYEWIMEKELDIPNSDAKYVNLLDEKYYFTIPHGEQDPRTRIINNCLGNKYFCPIVRKTKELEEWAKIDMMQLKHENLSKLSVHLNTEILGRSVAYLYTKETKSSTEIEKEDSRADKTQKFFRVLKSAGTIDLSKKRLLFIQNQIVNDNVKSSDYRNEEIYVGETRYTKNGPEENIHYIGPKYQDVSNLMRGLLDMHEKFMLDGSLPAMIHAAIISFGLVYIHPFSDGNGRVHRYLIHDVLKVRSERKDDFIIPVSAAILKHVKQYDTVLESISKPIMALLDYALIEKDNSITINNSLLNMYRYPDFTDHVIFLYEMMDSALNVDLLDEIIFILKFDNIKKNINDKLDLVNKELDLLVKLLLQGDGLITKKIRKIYVTKIEENGLNYVSEVAVKTIKCFNDLSKKSKRGIEN